MKIYQIDDFRIQVHPDSHTGYTWKEDPECHHHQLTFREEGQIITCGDCKQQVTAWWAFLSLVKAYDRAQAKLKAERDQLERDKAISILHKGALQIQDAWRRRKLVPTCPHCYKPILPPHNFGATGSKNRTHYAHECKPMEFRPAPAITAGWKAGK
jgi:RNase P subunit RPR2